MNVLLLNPPGPFCRAGSRWPHRRKQASVGIDYHPFPFSLAYATSRLLADGHDARIVDCIALGMDDGALRAECDVMAPDVVVMETSAPSFSADVETMKLLGRPCIAVGAHATATCDEHIEAGFAGVIYGEYDQIVSDAIHLESRPWLALPNAPASDRVPLVEDLDSLPYPPWDQMPMEKYNDPFCKGRSVTVLSTRGCPYQCSFCTIEPFAGRRNYRLRDPGRVCDEIAALIEKYRPDEVYFDDDTITANGRHVVALCEEYRARSFGLPFSCMGSAAVPRDVLRAMADAGCRAYKFGVETGDPAVLERIPKLVDLDDVTRTVGDCRRMGIKTHATFLFGLPGETRESALRTIDFALGLKTHTLQFAIATPYPGTRFYDEAVANGWLVKESWLQFDPAGEAVVSYPDYSAGEIAEMHDLAWRRWQWHMLTRRPETLIHHFGNALRREGVGGTVRLARYGASRLLDALRHGR
ncbi:MAG: radical SAM protein [bacterium]|nr:radical SAM protein [bacterium]